MQTHFRETNTVYQYNGCWIHGCKECFAPSKHDRKVKIKSWKSLDERRQATENSEKYIIEQGFKLVTMWECTWKSILAQKRPVNKYHYPGEEKYRLTEHELLRMTLDGSFFVALEVDIHVPDHLKAKFAEMTPIFKNTEVSDKDIGDFMTNYLKESGNSFKTTRYLIGSMFGERILLSLQ